MRKLFLTTALIAAMIGGFNAPAKAGDGEIFGTLGGAALGGFIGNQFGHGAGRAVGTGIGVFTGAVLGNSFGRSLDRPSYSYGGGYGYGYYPSYYAPSYYYEQNYVAPPAPPPPSVVYVQPQVIEYREREPAHVEGGYVGAGSTPYCREFTQQIRIGNDVQESYGTACLQPDGSWRIER